MATTDNAPAIEAAADSQPVTDRRISNAEAFQVLGHQLEQLELRVIRIHDDAGSYTQQRMESIFQVLLTVRGTYRQIQGDLIRKALGGD